MKRFSIIITTHNRRELFERAFKSAVNQNFDDYEIVVVNNGDDKVDDIIEKNKKNREIKLISYNERRSPAISANIGIKNSKGEWICFLDDDDEVVPYYLEEINKNITPKDNWLLINGILKKGNKEKLFLGEKEILFLFRNMPKTQTPLQSFKNLFQINYVYKWAQVIKKTIYEKLGFFDENLFVAEDVEFILRLSLDGYVFKLIEKPLYIYYTNFIYGKIKNDIEASFKIYGKYKEIIEKDKEILAKFFYNLGWLYLQLKEDKQAFRYFKKSFLLKPGFKPLIRLIETKLELNKKLNFEKFLNKITGRFWLE